MSNKTLSLLTLIAVVFCPPQDCFGQVVLAGCTGNTTPTSPTSFLVDIDPASGSASNFRNTGVFALAGIAAQPGTNLVFGLTTFASAPANALVRLDLSTGTALMVGFTGLTNIVEGDLAFNPTNGLLYGIQYVGPANNQRSLIQINPLSGVASVIGSLSSTGDYSALAFDAMGNLFAIDTNSNTDALVMVNTNNGAILSSVPLNANLGPGAALAFHPVTGVAYVSDGSIGGTNLLYTLDVGIGALAVIGSTGASGGIVGLTFVSVPEPSSFLLTIAVIPVACFRSLHRIRRSQSKDAGA